jgi:hypothetical protein
MIRWVTIPCRETGTPPLRPDLTGFVINVGGSRRLSLPVPAIRDHPEPV